MSNFLLKAGLHTPAIVGAGVVLWHLKWDADGRLDLEKTFLDHEPGRFGISIKFWTISMCATMCFTTTVQVLLMAFNQIFPSVGKAVFAKPEPFAVIKARVKRRVANVVDHVRGAHASKAGLMAESAPARAGAPEGFAGFDALSDHLVLRVFARAPAMTHGTLHAVCRRLKSLLRSQVYLKQRLENRLGEYGLVLAGGRRDNETMMEGECSMLAARRWIALPPMSEPRVLACSVMIENELWVIGGLDWHAFDLMTVEIYSYKTNSWRSCKHPMRYRRMCAVAGVVGGRLVVAGGRKPGADGLTSVEAYNGKKWILLPGMPHAADEATGCVLNGRLYVIGGRGSRKLRVLELKRSGPSWSCKADLPDARHAAASVVFRGRIWLMGGWVNGKSTASVIMYDDKADKWLRGPPLPVPCRDCRAAEGDGGIVLYGFTQEPGYYPQLSLFAYRNAWAACGHPPDRGPGSHMKYSACGIVYLG